MKQIKLLFLSIIFFITSCQEKKDVKITSKKLNEIKWNIESLNEKAHQLEDSTTWDLKLLKQDIVNYANHSEILQSYPLNNTPFPVADYEYAVSSNPFAFINNDTIYKGVRVGAYENFESDKIIDKLTLILVTIDKDVEETTFVVSRNYPYLTAQGYFITTDNIFDWVFSASPDGFSTLMINMKLFDLRFGETILIYPQTNKSFNYKQIKDSPNNYNSFEKFKAAILNNK